MPVGHAVRFRIPARRARRVAQPEGAGQIDDAHARVDERGREFRRRRIGQREEHEVGLALERVGVERRDRAVPEPAERRQPSRGGGGARRRRQRDADRRMPRQQPQQLLPGVAGRAGDRHARHAPERPRARRSRLATCTVCIEKNNYT